MWYCVALQHAGTYGKLVKCAWAGQLILPFVYARSAFCDSSLVVGLCWLELRLGFGLSLR